MVKELNGARFNDRQIYVKLHVPFSPMGKPIFGGRRNTPDQAKLRDPGITTESSNTSKSKSPTTKEADGVLPAVPGSSNIEDIPFTDEPKKDVNGDQLKKMSKDTIFIGNASDRTVDKDVRELFKDFFPTQVFIFRGANQRRMQRAISLRQKTVSVLVTLKNEEDLSRAIEELDAKKLNGRSVYLKAAHLSKIEEVVKAAKANTTPDKSPPTTATVEEEAQEQKSNTTAETSILVEMFKETQKKIQGKYKTIEKQTKPSEPLLEETDRDASTEKIVVA